jgi:hypothetical protein
MLCNFRKGGHANSFCLTQIVIRKNLRCASPKIANPQICNDLMRNSENPQISLVFPGPQIANPQT